MSWEEVQRSLREAKTATERQAAAQALAGHLSDDEKAKHLVSMQKGGVNIVSLGDLPRAMQDPQVYNRVKKIVTGSG